MSDHDLRTLERAAASGSPADVERLNRARVRAGLKPLKRRIVHYVPPNAHDRVTAAGKIARAPHWDQHVYAVCSVELYPRRDHYNTRRKHCYFTVDPAGVTCKTCLRWFTAKKRREYPLLTHIMTRLQNGRERSLCGRRLGTLIDDEADRGVTCYACRRIRTDHRLEEQRAARAARTNKRQRRRMRRRAARAAVLFGG